MAAVSERSAYSEQEEFPFQFEIIPLRFAKATGVSTVGFFVSVVIFFAGATLVSGVCCSQYPVAARDFVKQGYMPVSLKIKILS